MCFSGFKDCTAALKSLSDDLYDFVQDIKQNGANVQDTLLKKSLESATSVAKNCFESDADLTTWDDCLDDLWPSVADLGKLVADVKNGQTANLLADALAIANDVSQGVQKCKSASLEFEALA